MPSEPSASEVMLPQAALVATTVRCELVSLRSPSSAEAGLTPNPPNKSPAQSDAWNRFRIEAFVINRIAASHRCITRLQTDGWQIDFLSHPPSNSGSLSLWERVRVRAARDTRDSCWGGSLTAPQPIHRHHPRPLSRPTFGPCPERGVAASSASARRSRPGRADRLPREPKSTVRGA